MSAKAARRFLFALALISSAASLAGADVLYDQPSVGGAFSVSGTLPTSLSIQIFIYPLSDPIFCLSNGPLPPECLGLIDQVFTPADQGTIIKLTATTFAQFTELTDYLTSTTGSSPGWVVFQNLTDSSGYCCGGGFSQGPISGQIDEVDFTLTELCISSTPICHSGNSPQGYNLADEWQLTILGTSVPEPAPVWIVALVLTGLLVIGTRNLAS